MIKEIKKRKLNLEEIDLELVQMFLTAKDEYFVDQKILSETKTDIEVELDLDNLTCFEQYENKSELLKLRLGLSLIDFVKHPSNFFKMELSPENLYVTESLKIKQLYRVYAPYRQEETEYVVKSVKALIGFLFVDHMYLQIYNDFDETLMKNSLTKELVQLETLDEIEEFLNKQIIEKQDEVDNKKILVNKNFYKRTKRNRRLLSVLTIIMVAIVIFTYGFYVPNRNAQLKAFSYYQIGKYESIVDELDNVPLTAMTPLSKYIMSVATIKLTNMEDYKKDNILFNLSPQVDEGILDFWVYIGDMDYQKAYDQSIKNNDAQQKGFALIMLMDQVTNNPKLTADDKETQLSQYQSELDAINKSMEAPNDN